MRYGRLLLGAFVVLLAGWVIIGEQLSGVSANAFVNARVSTLRAPVAGTLTMPERELGARVMRGEELGQITDRLVDGVRLDDLLLEQALAAAELARLDTDQTGTEAERTAAQTRVAALQDRIGRERLRVNRFGSSAITSTADGQLWTLLAADGETLQRGEPVMQVLDCRSLIVTLSVTEAIFNRLQPGDSAVFRLTGDSRRFDGSVIRLAGAGASSVYQNLAVTPGQRHLERFDVALVVPGLRNDPGIGCPVGRTGRVFFESRPLDRLRNLRFW
ncbi:MAG: HlyD family efflux transporter periplasmic adaptor subunit [Pararhodobacter sp.]